MPAEMSLSKPGMNLSKPGMNLSKPGKKNNHVIILHIPQDSLIKIDTSPVMQS